LIDTSDGTDAEPVRSYGVVAGELSSFSSLLAEKPVIVAATKLDATTDRTRLEELRKFCVAHDLEFHAISAATGEGVRDLIRSIADALDKIPRALDSALDLADDSAEDTNVASQPSQEAH
jgi:GTP-binding protein